MTHSVTRTRYSARHDAVPTRPKKQRGSIDELPSGALRVRVHDGEDPLSGSGTLVEIIPAGPKAAAHG